MWMESLQYNQLSDSKNHPPECFIKSRTYTTTLIIQHPYSSHKNRSAGGQETQTTNPVLTDPTHK